MPILGSQASLFRTLYPLILSTLSRQTDAVEDKDVVGTVRRLVDIPGRTRKRTRTDLTSGGLAGSDATLYRGGMLWPF